MEGRREVGELFAVDKWRCRSQAYFLTHMHSDHTAGLSNLWSLGPLYCSQVSASLLSVKFPGIPASLIHTLPLASPSLLPVYCPRSRSRTLLEVTAIHADHCPGAVMYIFRGEFGCIIHTGDFRWEVEGQCHEVIEDRKQQILSAIGGASVDVLHLDNTYCNQRFLFPPRHVAAQQVIDIISNHKDTDVVIGVDNLGKEELLLFVAESFNTKIWVWPERLQTMRILGLPDVFTTDTTVTRIRAVPRYSISPDTLFMLNKMRPTIAILPTSSTLFFSNNPSSKVTIGGSDLSVFRGTPNYLDELNSSSPVESLKPLSKNIYSVLYSLHSCYTEINAFVEFINPKEVNGNSKSRAYDINPTHLLGNICSKKNHTSTS